MENSSGTLVIDYFYKTCRRKLPSQTFNYLPPFLPECSPTNPDEYAAQQNDPICLKSWCSTKDGHMLKDTFSQYNTNLRCGKQTINQYDVFHLDHVHKC